MKWAFRHKHRGGRPRKSKELEPLVIRLALENRDWGNARIEGECRKLGYDITGETVGNILDRHGIPPAPECDRLPSWQHLMTHYKEQLLACDFFTIEALFLRTIYVFLFIEVVTRRVHFAGCTDHPKAAWVIQQARQLVWELEGRDPPLRFLIRDNDRKYTASFDHVFRPVGMKVIRTPYQAPNANAYTERWVRTVREEL